MAIFELLPRITRPLFALGLISASSLSYGAVARQLVTQPVDDQHRVTLRGNVRPLPRGARDLGAVEPGLPASRVLLLLKRPPEQEAALATFLSDVHTPGSASYHKWMTPAEFGRSFGPAEPDVQAAVAWLQAQGFAVSRVSPARTSIEFSGTAAQLQSAFNTQIHTFSIGGETHVSNITEPQIPAALAPVVAGVSPLNDFRLKPLHTAALARVAAPAPTASNPYAFAVQKATVGSEAQNSSLQPDLTVPGSNGNPNTYYVTPGDLATIYNTPNSTLNTKYAASASLTGSGVTVGIAGVSNVDLGNVSNYRKLFGLPAVTPSIVVDGTDPGVQGDAAVEALLDLEMVSAIAPAANQTLYISQDTTFQQGLFLAIQRALDDNAVSILNVSFGGCEAYQLQSGNQEVLNFWQQAAAQGISVTVSTGDSGAAGCDSANATQALQGLQVNALASTPYNIAVGGTDFNESTTTAPQFWSSTNSSIFESANGPIPEIPWNNSTTTIGGLAGNSAFRDSQGATRIDGAGGGVSGCLTANLDSSGNVTGCTGQYAKPSWQSGFGSGTARALPDVSLFSANGGHLAAYLICASGLGGDSTSTVDCTPGAQGGFGFQGVGGTSASSPAFAGMLALVIQQLQNQRGGSVRLGQADFTLYPLSKQHPNAFHDVTTGNISVVCGAGSTNCGANGFLTGYDATAGYDLATGLGSVDATQMVQNWSSISFKPTSTSLTLNGSTSPLNIQHGTAVAVVAGVTSSAGGTPTGDIALVDTSSAPGTAVAAVQGTTASPSIFALNGGTATGSYAYLPGGSYSVHANYEGDGSFGASVSNGISVNVSAESSTLELSIEDFNASTGAGSSVTNTSVPYGTWISVVAQPVATSQVGVKNPINTQATGSVTFSSSNALLSKTVAINSNGFAEIPNQVFLAYPPGSYSVSASYGGDASFHASNAAAQSFTVTKAASSLSAPSASGSGSLTIQVDPSLPSALAVSPGIVLPTGTVTVTNGAGASVGTGTLQNVTLANGATTAQAAIALDTTKLTAGANTLTVTYGGDGNYSGNNSTITYTLGAGGGSANFSLSEAPSSITVARGSSATTTVTITPQSGFTGTVNLSCAVSGGSTTIPPTCALAQASVSVSGGAATDILTVATQTTSAAIHLPVNPAQRNWYTAGGAALAGLLLLGLPGRRRAWQRMLCMLLLVAGIGFVGCGGGSGGGSHTTPAGSYTVTVTATSGSGTATSTVAVVVQ